MPGIARARDVSQHEEPDGALANVVTGDYTWGMNASVRTAKAHLSKLLDRVAAGEEIVITSGGRPKAKLVGLPGNAPVPFRVNRALLRGRVKKGSRAEALVRAERDARN
jgi:prevent-host-death family protein